MSETVEKLSLVTSDQVPGGFSVMENGAAPSLVYVDSKGKVSGIYLKSGNNRPLRCSELENKLKKRKYHIWDLKYVPCVSNSDGLISVEGEGEGFSSFKLRRLNPFSDRISSDVPSFNATSSDVGFNYSTHIKDSGAIEEELVSIKSSDPCVCSEWLESYKNVKSNINFNNSGISLTLIDRYSDVYTDTIDFRDLINYSRQANITAHVILELGFTIKVTNSFGATVYKLGTREIEFNLFSYSSTAESISIENFIIENDGFIVEFIDGVLRTTSKENVTECIINNCIVEYGKLN